MKQRGVLWNVLEQYIRGEWDRQTDKQTNGENELKNIRIKKKIDGNR